MKYSIQSYGLQMSFMLQSLGSLLIICIQEGVQFIFMFPLGEVESKPVLRAAFLVKTY